MPDDRPLTLEELLDRMEDTLARVDAMPEEDRERVFTLLDDVDRLHRLALHHLGDALGPVDIERLRDTDPSVTWLFDAYGVGLDERATAERAMEDIRPYIHSHGGEVEILDVTDGRVHVRLAGSCSGCTASAITLQHGVETALRDHLPEFTELTVEEDDADPHAPPGGTLLQIEPHPESSLSPPT